jgi:GxxExxY protein
MNMNNKAEITAKVQGDNHHYSPVDNKTEEIGKSILDAAYQVHSTLGPGLLESVYESCLVHEQHLRNINTKSQITLPVVYKGITVDSGYRLDILVEDYNIVEIKSTDGINPVHRSQLVTYLKLTNKRLGFLLNFNTIHLRDGIKRVIN